MEWILIGLLVGMVVVGIGVVFALKTAKDNKKKSKEIDYYVFFVLGISFLPMGIIFSATISPGFMGFMGLGAVYMAIGLAHKDKWKTNKKKK